MMQFKGRFKENYTDKEVITIQILTDIAFISISLFVFLKFIEYVDELIKGSIDKWSTN